MAGTAAPVMVSRTVVTEDATLAVLMVAEPAITAPEVMSPVMVQVIAPFSGVGVGIVIWRPLEVVKVGASVAKAPDPFWQAADKTTPARVLTNGRPVTEIKAMLLVASIPVKLMVTGEATDGALLVNVMEAA